MLISDWSSDVCSSDLLAGKLRFASFLPSGLARCCLSQESETWFRLCGAPISAGFANVSTTARASKSGRRSPLWDKKREQQGRLIHVYIEGSARGQRHNPCRPDSGHRCDLGPRDEEGLCQRRRTAPRAGI